MIEPATKLPLSKAQPRQCVQLPARWGMDPDERTVCPNCGTRHAVAIRECADDCWFAREGARKTVLLFVSHRHRYCTACRRYWVEAWQDTLPPGNAEGFQEAAKSLIAAAGVA